MTPTDGPKISSRAPLLRLVGLFRPYLFRVSLAMFAGVAALALGLEIPTLTERLVNQGILAHDRSKVWRFACIVLGVGTLRVLMNVLRRSMAWLTTVRIETELRNRLFAHLQGL